MLPSANVHNAAVAQMPVTPADATHAGTLVGKPLGEDGIAQSGRNVDCAAHGRRAAAARAVEQAASLIWQTVGSAGTCSNSGGSDTHVMSCCLRERFGVLGTGSKLLCMDTLIAGGEQFTKAHYYAVTASNCVGVRTWPTLW